jgi:RNA polymerase sigma-70 factor (ECF subfamily)
MAEDLCQDVFLKIWRALPRFLGPASLSSWIYTITRNTRLTALKGQKPTLSLSDPKTLEGLEGRPELHANAESAGTGLDVHALLAELPDKYRQVITLFYLEQKSYEEVAAMLGLPMGTAKTYLHCARKELLRLSTRRAHPTPPA